MRMRMFVVSAVVVVFVGGRDGGGRQQWRQTVE